jgi:hypothetical protein
VSLFDSAKERGWDELWLVPKSGLYVGDTNNKTTTFEKFTHSRSSPSHVTDRSIRTLIDRSTFHFPSVTIVCPESEYHLLVGRYLTRYFIAYIVIHPVYRPLALYFLPFSARKQSLYVPNCTVLPSVVSYDAHIPLLYRPLRHRPHPYRPSHCSSSVFESYATIVHPELYRLTLSAAIYTSRYVITTLLALFLLCFSNRLRPLISRIISPCHPIYHILNKELSPAPLSPTHCYRILLLLFYPRRYSDQW